MPTATPTRRSRTRRASSCSRADEDFCKTSGPEIEKGYGYMRVYDYSDPGRTRSRSASTGRRTRSGTDDQAAGDYSIHNNFLVGTDVYSSWYSDGVRVVDTARPDATRPRSPTSCRPPARTRSSRSQRGVLTNMPQVWGVVVDEATGLIYASDMNTGLWILRRTD